MSYCFAAMVVQARQLNLPQSYPSSSLLFDPTFLSLALMHSDSSFSLYPSLSFEALPSSLPPPQTRISSPTSSAAFLRLQNPSRLIFLVSSPHLGGASVLIRFWILIKNQSFSKAQVSCSQRDLKFDQNKSGVVFGVDHGVSVKLVGSINVFAMYSVSNRKVWVFALRMVGDDDGVNIKLMKCAVIDCFMPIFSINVSFEFLILGEDDGVRVYRLRPLVKGKIKKHHRLNGKIKTINGGDEFYSNSSSSRSMKAEKIGHLEEKIDKHSNCAKPRPLKLRQDSREGGGSFVSFKREVESTLNSTKISLKSAKAISIQALSPNKFLIMDSVGDVHLLGLSNPVLGLEVLCYMKQLSPTLKVQKLAVLPGAQTIWISDGHHTVHVMAVADVDTSISESEIKNSEEKLMQISVTEAIFSSEKIQELVPMVANAILILGQGSIFAYEIS